MNLVNDADMYFEMINTMTAYLYCNGAIMFDMSNAHQVVDYDLSIIQLAQLLAQINTT